MRNRRLCLIIRIGDLRDDNFILGTQISAKIVRRRISVEGEVLANTVWSRDQHTHL